MQNKLKITCSIFSLLSLSILLSFYQHLPSCRYLSIIIYMPPFISFHFFVFFLSFFFFSSLIRFYPFASFYQLSSLCPPSVTYVYASFYPYVSLCLLLSAFPLSTIISLFPLPPYIYSKFSSISEESNSELT